MLRLVPSSQTVIMLFCTSLRPMYLNYFFPCDFSTFDTYTCSCSLIHKCTYDIDNTTKHCGGDHESHVQTSYQATFDCDL